MGTKPVTKEGWDPGCQTPSPSHTQAPSRTSRRNTLTKGEPALARPRTPPYKRKVGCENTSPPKCLRGMHRHKLAPVSSLTNVSGVGVLVIPERPPCMKEPRCPPMRLYNNVKASNSRGPLTCKDPNYDPVSGVGVLVIPDRLNVSHVGSTTLSRECRKQKVPKTPS